MTDESGEPKRFTVFKDAPRCVDTLRKSYKNRLKVPDKYSLQGELAGESDRSTVILMSALLEDALTLRIAQHLCFSPTEREFNDIFHFDGPLGTFSARMKIAFYFGFIEDATYEQLNLIREMRNACAHSKHQLKFTDEVLGNVTKRLFQPLGFIPAVAADTEIKGAFIAEGTFIFQALVEGSREKAAETMKAMFRTLKEQNASQDKSS